MPMKQSHCRNGRGRVDGRWRPENPEKVHDMPLLSRGSGLNDLDGVVSHPTGAVVMAHLDEVVARNQVGGNARVGINATVIVFRDQRRFTVGTEKFHDHIGGATSINNVTTITGSGESE